MKGREAVTLMISAHRWSFGSRAKRPCSIVPVKHARTHLYEPRTNWVRTVASLFVTSAQEMRSELSCQSFATSFQATTHQ